MPASFERGQRFQLQGTVFLIRDRNGDRVTVTDESFGGDREFMLTDLMEAWTDGRLRLAYAPRVGVKPRNDGCGLETTAAIPDLTQIDPTLREEARRRHELVRAMLSLPADRRGRKNMGDEIKKAAADWDPTPSIASVYRWIKAYRASGYDIRSLVSLASKRGGKENSRLDPAVQEVIGKAISTVYMVREPGCVQAVADYAEALLKEAGLPVPGEKAMYMRVSRAIDRIPPYDVAVAHHGQKKADAMFMASGPSRRVKRIMEIVEIDHTPLDILVLPDVPTELDVPQDALFGLATRPYLTACRDRKTGLTVGWHVGFDSPGWFSVSKCLRHAIMFKSPDFLRRECPDLRHDYPVYGIPEIVLCDNGLEFHSTHLDDAAQLLNFSIDYCPVRTPWLKGTVERGFRAVNAIFQSMPGTTFSNIIKRDGYDSVKNACIPFSLLKQLLYKIFVDIEARRYRDRLFATRIDAWMADEFRPRLPNNVDELVVFLGQVFTRTISAQGIKYKDLTYFNDDLANIRCALPKKQWKVTCKSDPSDLGRIWVLDPRSNSFLEVPAVHQDYAAGLTLWNHSVIKRYARKYKGAKSHAELVEAKADLRRMVEQKAVKRNGKRAESPRRATRFLTGDTPPSPETVLHSPGPAGDVVSGFLDAVRDNAEVVETERTHQEEGPQLATQASGASVREKASQKSADGGAVAPAFDADLDDDPGEFEVEIRRGGH